VRFDREDAEVTAPRSVRMFLFIVFLLAALTYLVSGIALDLRGPWLEGGGPGGTTDEDLFRMNRAAWHVAITSFGVLLVGLILRLTDLVASRSPVVSRNQASDA
jgi:hypothetical protein